MSHLTSSAATCRSPTVVEGRRRRTGVAPVAPAPGASTIWIPLPRDQSCAQASATSLDLALRPFQELLPPWPVAERDRRRRRACAGSRTPTAPRQIDDKRRVVSLTPPTASRRLAFGDDLVANYLPGTGACRGRHRSRIPVRLRVGRVPSTGCRSTRRVDFGRYSCWLPPLRADSPLPAASESVNALPRASARRRPMAR